MNEKDNVTIPNTQHFISGIPYPATCEDIIEYARNKGAPGGIIDLLQKLPDEEYQNESQVIDALDMNK